MATAGAAPGPLLCCPPDEGRGRARRSDPLSAGRLGAIGLGVLLVGLTVAGCLVFRPPTLLVIANEIDVDAGEAVDLLITGDIGTGNENQRAVAAVMEGLCARVRPHAVLLLGDNFYDDGVTSVDDPQWEAKFERMYDGPCLARTRFFAVLGNHDYHGNVEAQIAYTARRADRWTLPARFYSVRFGRILHLAVVDTNSFELCGIARLCGFDWTREELRASAARWKVVAGHHPALSSGRHTPFARLRGLTLPRTLCQARPDLYLAGHDHNLQHLIGVYEFVPRGIGPLLQALAGTDCLTEQLVVGGGGGGLYAIGPPSPSRHWAMTSFGVLHARFDGEEARYVFHAAPGGEALYGFVRRKD